MAEKPEARKARAGVKFPEDNTADPPLAEEAPLLADEAPAPQEGKVLRKVKRKPKAVPKEKPSFPAAPKLLVRLADRRLENMDASTLGTIFVEIVLWASSWGIVDMAVNMAQYHITKDPVMGSFLCMLLYGCVVMAGILIGMCIHDGSFTGFPLVPVKVVEFGSLVLLLAGSWGVVDSLASLLARGTALLVLFWYLFFALVASLVLTWHHLQNPNELLDRLVLS